MNHIPMKVVCKLVCKLSLGNLTNVDNNRKHILKTTLLENLKEKPPKAALLILSLPEEIIYRLKQLNPLFNYSIFS